MKGWKAVRRKGEKIKILGKEFSFPGIFMSWENASYDIKTLRRDSYGPEAVFPQREQKSGPSAGGKARRCVFSFPRTAHAHILIGKKWMGSGRTCQFTW